MSAAAGNKPFGSQPVSCTRQRGFTMTHQIETADRVTPVEQARSRSERFCADLVLRPGHRAAVAWLSLLFVAVAAPRI